MKQDEIIEMCVQAGMAREIAEFNIEIVETFAKLVAAKEREACAKLVEHPFFGEQCKECADAIRARGEA